jgi:hypothetical protein
MLDRYLRKYSEEDWEGGRSSFAQCIEVAEEYIKALEVFQPSEGLALTSASLWIRYSGNSNVAQRHFDKVSSFVNGRWEIARFIDPTHGVTSSSNGDLFEEEYLQLFGRHLLSHLMTRVD